MKFQKSKMVRAGTAGSIHRPKIAPNTHNMDAEHQNWSYMYKNKKI